MRDLCVDGMAQTSRMHLGSTRANGGRQNGGASLGGIGPITKPFRGP